MTGPVTVYRSVPQTVPVTVDVDTTLSVLHRCQGTDRRQTICILPYIGLWLSGQDVDRNGLYAVSRSTSDLMTSAIRRSLPKVKVGKVRLAVTFPHTTSTTWHQKMPCIVPYPVTTPVIFLTGPFIGYLVTDQFTGQPVTCDRSTVNGH